MKRIIALLLSLVMVLSLVSTGFAAMGGYPTSDTGWFTDSDWDFTVTLEDTEDDADSLFATYQIEATAKEDRASAFWATLTDVEKGDDFRIEIDGEDEFIKVAALAYADIVIRDDKTVTFFAVAAGYEDGWDGKAVRFLRTILPDDEADRRCAVIYSLSAPSAFAEHFYYYDKNDDGCYDVLCIPDAAGDILLNYNGVCVVAREAVEGVDYIEQPHSFKVEYSDAPTNSIASKVYCDACGRTDFRFVKGPESVAIAAFGVGNYQRIGTTNIWVNPAEYVESPSTGGAEAEVVAPTVDSNVKIDKIKDPEEKKVVEAVVETLTQPDAVQFDEKANVALSEAAAKVAENDNVKVTTDKVEALADTLEQPVAEEDVVVVVQTNFDVKIEEVSVDKKSGDATIKLDITPVYQHVATTKDVVESGADIKVGENAVTVSKKPQKVTQKITESVSITIAIPDVLIEFAQKNDNKLYVTHKKTNGTKFVYEAQVDVANKTATFINPNGFSEFVISVEDTTAAEISGMKYADLQSAIDNAGKDAVITVKVSDQQAVVSSEMTFKLVYEGDATAENTKITAANGYKLSGPDKNGVYTVTKVSYGQGGYYPSISITPDTTDKTVTSPKTFDAGIGLYVGMGIISLTGSAWLMRKKEK